MTLHTESAMRRPLRFTLPLLAFALVAAASHLGPPRITVRAVTGTPPTAGAVLDITTHHHTEEESADVSGRALAMRNGARVSRPITITAVGTPGRYGVAKQWENGTAWVLVFTVKQGEHGSHGTAEAMVRVDATGRIGAITMAGGTNARGDRFPRAFTEREVEAALEGTR